MSKIGIRGKVIVGAILCLVAIVVGVKLVDYIKQVQKENRPKPVVVSYRADDMSSSLTEYSARVITVVRNDGGAGYVTIYSTMRNVDKDRSYTHNKRVWISKGSTMEVEIIFNEPKFFSLDDWECWSSAVVSD